MFLGWDADGMGLAFDVACHVGTLLAVIAYFRHDLWAMLLAAPQALSPRVTGPGRLVRLVVLGTVPVVIVGGLWASAIEQQLRAPGVTVITLIVGAVGFFLAEWIGSRTRDEVAVGHSEAFVIGCAQAVALVPGVSRSGATMTVGMLYGLRRESAARFSFLLGVPAILAAAAHASLELVQTGMTAGEAGTFLAGMVVSAVVGYGAIAALLRYLSRHSLAVFAWYRLALAATVLAWMYVGRG